MIPVGWMHGLEKIKINNSNFDEKFEVFSNDKSFVHNFLKPDIQKLLLQLGKKYLYPAVLINKGDFKLISDTRLFEEKEYETLIDASIQIYNKFKSLV